MISLTVKEIIHLTCGELLKGNEQRVIKGITTDSRKCGESDLFIPLTGERYNGHVFIDDAVKNGIKAVLVSESQYTDQYDDLIVIKVGCTLKALHNLAKYQLSRVDIQIGRASWRERV